MMRRHLLILLVLTILVRGWLMISYPMSGNDDNQAGQNYLIDQLLHGNLLIGNLRFQTGYPFVIAPVVALAQPLDRFDDRFILLVQVALSSTIPFMIYDILRRRRTQREALIVALFVLLDPFGWQWAHFYLPEWLIAFCLVFALWLVERGGWSLRTTGAAGIVLGLASLMRVNVIPLVILLCLLVFALRVFPLRRRAVLFLTLATASAGIFLLHFVLIQYPSTGSWRVSCISGINLLYSNSIKGLEVKAENGANSARYLDLLARGSPHEFLFVSSTYGFWSQPGIWATPDEQRTFLDENSPRPYPASSFTIGYYLGLCATDDFLRAVFVETVASDPVRWVAETVRFTFDVLVQTPVAPDMGYVSQILPRYDSLLFDPGGVLGFRQARAGFYTGQWVWTPGIWLFSTLFPIWNLVKWLTIPALVWALWSRRWFYSIAALLLLSTALSLSITSGPEPRVYAAVYPFWPILIGGMVAAILRRLERT